MSKLILLDPKAMISFTSTTKKSKPKANTPQSIKRTNQERGHSPIKSNKKGNKNHKKIGSKKKKTK